MKKITANRKTTFSIHPEFDVVVIIYIILIWDVCESTDICLPHWFWFFI